MEKKILIILGSGASKSLMPIEKHAVIGVGRYRELPTGDGLLNEIIQYGCKSIAWFIAHSCYYLIKTNVCSINKDKNDVINRINPNFDFLDISKYVEGLYPKGYYHILTEEEVKSLKDNLQKEYSKYFTYDLQSKEDGGGIMMSFSIGVDGINSSIGNDGIVKMSKLFQASDFIKTTFDNVAKSYKSSGNDLLVDAIFFKLLTLAISDHTIYNKIEKLLNARNALDLFLSRMYGSIREIMSNIRNIATANIKHSRLSANEIAPDSLYKTKNDAFDKVIQNIKNILINNTYIQAESGHSCNITLDDIKSNIIGMREALSAIYNEIIEYSKEPPENRSGMIDSFIEYSTNYIEGLFGITTTQGIPTIDNNILNNINSCKTKFEEFEKIENLTEADLNDIVRTLYENSFNLGYNARGRVIINNLKISNTLLLNIARYITANIFNTASDYSKFIEIANHLKGCFLSASLVSHYKPYSIDYFMMNLEHLASYEFYDIKGSKNLIEERIKHIQKYTKFIIADCLMPAATYAHYAREHDNYIQRMKWRILENALFYKKTLSEYLHENVKIITFNYEMSFETLLYEMLSKEDADKLHSSIVGVYGKIYLEVIESANKNCINMCKEDAIWQSLFFNDNGIFAISTNGKHSENAWSKYVLCKDIFTQLGDRIKWIGEQQNIDEITKDRLALQEKIINADEVYFLGFGFDINNLYQLGIIDVHNKLEMNLQNKERHTKILVSGGSARIINILKDVFMIDNCSSVKCVYHLKNEKYDIYISPKLLPEALIKDL